MKGSDILYSANGSYNRNTFNQTICIYRDWPQEEMFRDLDQMDSIGLRTADSILFSGANYPETVVTYLYPIPHESTEPAAVIMVLLKTQTIETAIGKQFSDYSANTFVLDREGKVVTARVEDENTAAHVSGLDETLAEGYSSTRIGGKDYIVETVLSDYFGWKYIAVLPEEDIYRNAGALFSRVHLFVGMVVLLGAGLMVLFMRLNYIPINRLRRVIEANTDLRLDRWGGVEILDKALDKVFQSLEDQNRHGEEQKAVLRQHLFLDALKGRFADLSEFSFAADRLEIPHAEKTYLALLIRLPQRDGIRSDAGIRKELEGIFLESGVMAVPLETMQDSTIPCIVLFDSIDRARQAIEELHTALLEDFGLPTLIGVGGVCSDALAVNRSYTEALAAMQHGLSTRGEGVVYAGELPESNEWGNWHDSIDLQAFREYLWQGDYTGLEGMLSGAVESARGKPPFLTRLLCFDIFNNVLRTLHEMGIDLAAAGADSQTLVKMAELEDPRAFQKQLLMLLRPICALISRQKESGNAELKTRIVQFLEEHYADPDLLLDTMADHLGMSYPYLSRYYKDQTGVTISEQLARVRIEKFKELAAGGETNIAEMAEQVGYLNLASFNRRFKKQEKITPKQYVDKRRQNKDNR